MHFEVWRFIISFRILRWTPLAGLRFTCDSPGSPLMEMDFAVRQGLFDVRITALSYFGPAEVQGLEALQRLQVMQSSVGYGAVFEVKFLEFGQLSDMHKAGIGDLRARKPQAGKANECAQMLKSCVGDSCASQVQKLKIR